MEPAVAARAQIKKPMIERKMYFMVCGLVSEVWVLRQRRKKVGRPSGLERREGNSGLLRSGEQLRMSQTGPEGPAYSIAAWLVRQKS